MPVFCWAEAWRRVDFTKIGRKSSCSLYLVSPYNPAGTFASDLRIGVGPLLTEPAVGFGRGVIGGV